jgi:hypothetical protein
MARTRKKKKDFAIPGPQPAVLQPTGQFTDIYLALVSAAAVICFFPLLKYFFAQDDFILIYTAWSHGWGAVADFFSGTAGFFRPLTKAAYFGLMYKIFGLNATPWHAVSMVVHIININLFFILIRRVGVKAAAALIVTTLFALSLAFFHVIAWISCIQQLLGQCFFLAALIWGIDYVRDGGSKMKWLSVAAYVLALLSVEQTFGLPVLLVGFFYLVPVEGKRGRPLLLLVRKLRVHLALMAVYLLFMGLWKTAPGSGAYAFKYGSNIWVNLVTYSGWTIQFWAALPSRMALGWITWSVTHILVVFLIVYNVLRRRWRETAFGLLFFVVTLFPTLFLENHTFYLHTYIPAFGLLYLIALFVQDILELRPLGNDRAQLAVLAVTLVAVSAGAFQMVRRNETYKMFDSIEMQRSFVLRRAEIAVSVYNGLRAEEPFEKKIEKVYLVYAREEGRKEAKWNRTNVEAAVGQGRLANLVYGRQDLEVVFGIAGDEIPWSEQYVADIYFFDDYGNLMKMDPTEQEAP